MFSEQQKWALEQFDALAGSLGSQNKACAQIGINTSIVSQLKSGKYAGNSDVQFSKLISYFGTKTEAAAAPSRQVMLSQYAKTSVSERVYEGIRNCQLQGGLATICGAAGIGKTMGAKQFRADHPNDSLYIAVNPCFRNIKALLKLLCTKLGIPERTIDEMWLGLANKLRDGMVIIFDDAQHLPIKTLEALRALADDFADRGQTLGLCFVGNPETVFGGKKRAEFAQISNRMKQRIVLSTSDTQENDIKLLFPATSSKMEVDLLLYVAHSVEGVRGTAALYTNAADNRDTSYDGLVAMAKHMGLAV